MRYSDKNKDKIYEDPLGKTVEVVIDRPLGSFHPDHPDIVYTVNYGFIPSYRGGDGEAVDVYVLDLDEPIEKCTAKIIAIIYRADDVENKLVATVSDKKFTKERIKAAVNFQEKYFKTDVKLL